MTSFEKKVIDFFNQPFMIVFVQFLCFASTILCLRVVLIENFSLITVFSTIIALANFFYFSKISCIIMDHIFISQEIAKQEQVENPQNKNLH